ncbi:MAG: hypothetical protein ABI609_16285 [Acidobacteriota bacterium]
MNHRTVLLLAGCLLCPASTAWSAPPSPLDERISIDLADADPGDALRSFSQLTGWKFTVDPAIKTKLTARLKNVRVRTALDVVCESVGCTWEEVAGNPPTVQVKALETRVSQPGTERQADVGLNQPISISLRDAAAADVLKSVGQLLDVEVAAAPFANQISIELKAAPVRQVLDEICRQIHCAWSLDTSGSAPVLRITAAHEN